MMREALDEPDTTPEPAIDETPRRRASDFVAAPALPLEGEGEVAFVVKPSAGRAGRRAMDDLREQALRNVIANASEPNSASRGKPIPRRPRGGMLSPSRIILMSVALIAGGVAAFMAAQLNATAPVAEPVVETVVAAPTTKVLVAKDVIGVGQRVTASAVEWIDWPDAAVRPEFVTDAAAPEAVTEMEGSVARAEILPGEPILEQKLASTNGGYLSTLLDTGKRGVSVSVSAASASGGFIVPNDYVDVVSTRISDEGQKTETILRNVRVLAINGQLGPQSTTDPEQPSDEAAAVFANDALATLALDSTQAELIINATAQGQLSLVLRSITDAAEAGTPEERAANQAIRLTSPFWQK